MLDRHEIAELLEEAKDSNASIEMAQLTEFIEAALDAWAEVQTGRTNPVIVPVALMDAVVQACREVGLSKADAQEMMDSHPDWEQ